MATSGQLARLEDRAGTGRVSLDGRMAKRFEAWLRSLSEAERWSFQSECQRPAHRARRTLYLVAGTFDAAEALAHRPPAELKGWKARQAELEKRWQLATVSKFKAFGYPPVPSEEQRQEILKAALQRLPAGFLAWARGVISQLDGLYGSDEGQAIQRMAFGHLEIGWLALSGSLLPNSWLEEMLSSKRRRKAK